MPFSCTTILEKEDNGESKPPLPQKKPRKRGGAMNILRVALFMASNKPKKAAAAAAMAEAVVARSGAGGKSSLWKALLCSMRPLHGGGHHHQQQLGCNEKTGGDVLQAALPPDAAADPAENAPAKVESFKDAVSPAASPAHSSVDGMSRYASAQDLPALGKSEDDDEDGSEEGEEDKVLEGDSGGDPNEIDLKAEEFIQKFYEEMRLQKQALGAKHHERIERDV